MSVSAHNLQTKREGLDVVIRGIEAGKVSCHGRKDSGQVGLQVVDVHVEHLHLLQKLGLGILEVEGREPIGAQVALDLGCGAARLTQRLARHIEAKIAGSHDGVNVS